MWPQAVRAVREVMPRAFVFENVKGLTRSTFASYLAYIVHQLTYPELVRNDQDSWEDHLRKLEQHHTSGSHSGLKYNVVWQVLNAADYGVPQKRERVVFVGFRSDIHVPWSFPRPTHSLDTLLWEQFVSKEYWERHSTLPTFEADKHAARIRTLQYKPRLAAWRTVRDAIGDLPDPRARGFRTVPDHRYQPGARSYPGHTGSHIDLPAKTLKAGVHGVPGGENMLLNPDGSVRYFTVRESARLQTFPDSYRFHGSWSETMRQLGNAVPVDLAAVVGRSVLSHLAVATNMSGDSSRNGFH
jgi:DNA (cytosine-5)-methyltransferase 1